MAKQFIKVTRKVNYKEIINEFALLLKKFIDMNTISDSAITIYLYIIIPLLFATRNNVSLRDMNSWPCVLIFTNYIPRMEKYSNPSTLFN